MKRSLLAAGLLAAGMLAPAHADTQPADAFGAPRPTSMTWSISPADVTVRQTLQRWARLAGWTFGPAEWGLQADITVAASATFQGDFVEAVQDLAAATSLSRTPLRACFYGNQVLRVLPYNELCDRTASPARP